MEDNWLLKEPNLRLEAILNAIGRDDKDIIIVDKDMKIIWANRNFEKWAGRLGDIKGKCCYQVYQNRDEPCENCPALKTFRTGRLEKTKQCVYDTQGNRRFCNFISVPLKDESRKVIAVVESIINLTERIELEHKLKLIKDELQAVFDGIEDGICVIDRDYQILRANQGILKIFDKRNFSDLLGRKCFIEYFENWRTCSNCPVQKTFESGKPCRLTKIYQKRDKKKVILDITTCSIRDCEGRIVRVVVYMRDITEVVNLEEQVLFNERLTEVGELAAGIAHEIKNPLGNIVAATQFCLSKQQLNEKTKNYLEIILRNAENANKIVKQLLSFAKPRELSFKLENITRPINRVCTLVKTKCVKQKVSVIKKWPRSIPSILLDSDLLEQTFLNLILNALDAMPNGGRLTITALVDIQKNEIVVNFVDTGEGISPENLDKVIDPFFTTKETGIGLGLSFVRHAIDCHKGKMSIKSKVDQGTKVIIRLPILR